MSEFNIDSYFADLISKAPADPVPNPGASTSKLDAIAKASLEKQQRLAQQSQSIEAIQRAKANSWSGQLGLDSDSILGGLVNFAAQTTEGINRVAGQIAAAPTTLTSGAYLSGVPDEVKAAYARFKNNEATPEDMRVLSLPDQQKDVNKPNFMDEKNLSYIRKTQGEEAYQKALTGGRTYLERLTTGEKALNASNAITTAFDQSNVVDRTVTNEAIYDLKDAFKENMAQVSQGSEKGGVSGAADMVSGVAGLLVDAAKTGFKNPQAVAELIANNAAQLGLAAALPGGSVLSNIPYGVDIFREAVAEYQKNNKGALPPDSELARIASRAVGAMAMESAGDALTLGKMGNLGKVADDAARGVGEAVDAGTRSGFKAALKSAVDAVADTPIGRVVGKTAGAAGGEAVTEATQTYLENDAKRKDTSGEELYVAGSLGAMVGGGIRGPLALVEEPTEMARKAAEQEAQPRPSNPAVPGSAAPAATQEQRTQAAQEAIASGNLDAFLDPKKPTYDPVQAIGVLVARSQAEGATEESKAQDKQKAGSIISELLLQQDDLKRRITMSSPEGIQQKLDELTQEIEAAPENRREIYSATKQAYEEMLGLAQSPEGQANLRDLQTKLSALERNISSAQTAYNIFQSESTSRNTGVDLESDINIINSSTNPDEVRASVDRVITAAMSAAPTLSGEAAAQIAENSRIGLTDQQRSLLRAYSDARRLETDLLNTKDVNQRVLFGAGKDKGIKQYREAVVAALDANNAVAAQKQLSGLINFAKLHESKAQAATAALARGKGTPILRTKEGRWFIPNAAPSAEDIRYNKGLIVNSPELVATIRKEADAIKAAQAELQLAIDLKLGNSTNSRNRNVTNPPSNQEGGKQGQAQSQNVQKTQGTRSNAESSAGSSSGRSNVQTTQQTVTTTPTSGSTARKTPEDLVAKINNATTVEEIDQVMEEADARYPDVDWTGSGEQTQDEKDLGAVIRASTQKRRALAQNAEGTSSGDTKKNEEANASSKNGESSQNTRNTQDNQGTENTKSTQQNQRTPSGAQSTEDTSVNQDNQVNETGQNDQATGGEPQGTGLTILRNAKDKLADYAGRSVGEIFRSMNRAVAWVKQRKSPEDLGSPTLEVLPLVDKPNLMTSWLAGEATPSTFFPEDYEFTESERQALLNFASFYKKYNKIVRDNFIKGGLKNQKGNGPTDIGLMMDPVQDFLNEDGTPDENLVTAVLYGAYSWMASVTMGSAVKTREDIARMHGFPDGTRIEPKGLQELKNVEVFRNTGIIEMGKPVVEALGLTFSKDGPTSYSSAVTAGFGAHAWKFLVDAGLVEEKSIPKSKIVEFIPALESSPEYSNANAQATNIYLTLPTEKNSGTGRTEYSGVGKEIKQATGKSRGVLDKFFGYQRTPKEASWEPIPFSQQKAKRTGQNISKTQARILQKAQEVPNYIIPEMWNLISNLGDQGQRLILRAAGWVDPTNDGLKEIPLGLREGVEAQNENLATQLDAMIGLVEDAEKNSPEKLNQPFFHNLEVWKNFRVGITTQNMNLQSSKIHRFMFYRKEWEAELDLNNADQVKAFEVAVAQAFGVKVDQMSYDKAVEKLNAMLQKDDGKLQKMIQKLHQASQKKAEISSGELQTIGDFAAGEEGMQTLQAMIAYGEYLRAKEAKQSKVTVRMLVGADGKTNGPILTFLALGVASTAEELYSDLNRGGMFSANDQDRNFNSWFAKGGNLDLYQDLMAAIRDQITAIADQSFDAIYRITGPLFNDKDGSITKQGRNFVKTPLTSFAFGSSVKKSIDNMAEKFVEAIYEQVQNTYLGKGMSQEELISTINYFLTARNKLPKNMTLDKLMEHEFTPWQVKDIKKAFTEQMGTPVENAMKLRYATYLERRNAVNSMAQIAFTAYKQMYDALRNQEIARLIRIGDIAGTVNKDGKAVPYHGLSANQEAALRKKLKKLLPQAHSAYSKMTGELDAGVYLAKSAKTEGDFGNHPIQTYFGTPVRGTNGIKIEASPESKGEVSPGVGGLPWSMHAADSTIMHLALEGTESLNVHDEIGNSFDGILKAAQKINKAVFDVFAQYSPAAEIYSTMERAITNAAQMYSNGEIGKAEVAGIIAAIAAKSPIKVDDNTSIKDVLQAAVNSLKYHQFMGDLVKLQALEQMASIDQYTWEGGEYRVTDQDRAKIARLIEQHKQAGADISPALAEAIDVLSKVTDKQALSPKDKLELEVDEVLEKEGIPLPPIHVMQLLEHGSTDQSLVKEMRDQFKALFKSMQSGRTLVEALRENYEKVPSAGEVIKWLAHRYQQIPRNAFGDLGTPVMKGNPVLEEFFQQNGDMPASKVLNKLMEMYRLNKKAPNREFNMALLKRLSELVDPKMMVRYVTSSTHPDMAYGKVDKARGWYALSPKGEEVYLLGSEFVHSQLTVETVAHELAHAALLGLIERIKNNPDDPKYAQARELVAELEQLLELAKSKDKQGKFAAATENINELVAWGLTNQEFQGFLKSLEMSSKNWKNALVDGMKAFIGNVLGLLFDRNTFSKSQVASNGLATFLANVSGLMAQAAVDQKESKLADLIVAPQMASMAWLDNLTTVELHQALDDGRLSQDFQTKLGLLLSDLSSKLMGPFESLKTAMRATRALTPMDSWLRTVNTGTAPFASSVAVSPLGATAQESFGLEMVEATVQAALNNNESMVKFAYKALSDLFFEAKKKLSAKDFYEGPDWDRATPYEQQLAQEKYDFIFDIQPGANDRSDYLARFAAFGLAHSKVNALLNFASTKEQAPAANFIERLQNFFDSIVSFFSGLVNSTYDGQRADEKLETLVEKLADIEAKRIARLNRPGNSMLEAISDNLDTVGMGAKDMALKAADLAFIKNSRFKLVKGASTVARAVLDNRVDAIMESILRVRDSQFKNQTLGVIASLSLEYKGVQKSFERLLAWAKRNEGIREQIITETTAMSLDVFEDSGKYLKEQHKKAITNVLLRSGLHNLMELFSLQDLKEIVTSDARRAQEIAALESQLNQFGKLLKAIYVEQASVLGYYKATQQAKGQFLLKNAHNIANLVGLGLERQLVGKDTKAAEEILSKLASLYAVDYMGAYERNLVGQVMDRENQRTDGNGVKFVLSFHKRLEQESLTRLFGNNPMLMEHGYLPEILNPHTDVKVASGAELQELRDMGYTDLGPLEKDSHDPTPEVRHLLVLKEGGLAPYVSGAISLKSLEGKGTNLHSGYLDTRTNAGTKNASMNASVNYNKARALVKIAKAQNGRRRDLFNDRRKYLVPLFNDQGDVVNFRYEMAGKDRDSLLDRDNRFERLLAVSAGSMFDKETTPEQNKTVIKALRDQFRQDAGTRLDSYVEIGPNSPEKRLRDIWATLPYDTKQEVIATWGYEKLYVRNDLVDVVFGQRAYSMREMFEKDPQDRKWYEKFLVNFFETAFEQWALLRGDTPDDAARYAKGTAIRVAKAERIWQEVMKEIKDIIVVKSLVVTLANIWSNMAFLKMRGVSLKEIAQHHYVAFKGAAAYRKDKRALLRAEMKLDSGYYGPGEEKKLQQEILHRKDAIARNPVSTFIDEGLMPTIVEDVSLVEDIYSYKSGWTKKIQKKLDNAPQFLQGVVKNTYMTHDTYLYQQLSRLTQLSDFVARYTLYQNLTQRSKDRLNHVQAIEEAREAFVNYDVPMQRGIQYLDNMGLILFTKYFFRIQRVIMKTAKDNPMRTLLVALLDHYMDLGPIILDSSAIAKFGNNPFQAGPLEAFQVLDELPAIHASLALIK